MSRLLSVCMGAKMFRKAVLAAGALMLSATVSHGSTAITFESFNNGDIVTNIVAGSLTATVSATGGIDAASICDTDLTPQECDDPDLLDPFTGNPGDFASDNTPSPLGKVLIVQERGTITNGTVPVADDFARGGTLLLTFNTAVTLDSVTVVDVEGGAFEIALGGITLNATDASTDGISGENLFEDFVPNQVVYGTSLLFRSSTSFAIDNISVTAVPLPASLALLLGGVAGLAAVRRRATA